SRFDVNTAYVAVNRIRVDDMTPHIYKTTDGGATWKKIITGLPNEPINAVREDAVRKGLLFAGSENAVYVSFDAGEHWQSLQLNMPSTSIRDLVIKDDDLVIGTHGRSFWILDNISSLRQLNASTKNQVALFKPQVATRVRWNMNTDTPLPPEEPAGENPPDGAMIEYYLPNATNDIVQIDILNQQKEVIRTFKSNDTLYKIPDVNIPLYWIRPQKIVSNQSGMHRLLWDMKYTPLNLPVSYPMTAVKNNTAPDATAPWVLPGTYTVRMTIGSKTLE
ncbi:MAG: WD40/YVTN/BNR-like repeat-containing protein, partial [Chitinophagaceae bacterium]